MEVITRADQLSVKHARGDEDPEVPKSSKPKRARKPKKNGNKNKGKKDTGVKNKDKKNTGEKNKGKKNSDTKNKGGIGKKKWCGIVGTFSELIVPNLAAGTKTKAEADFWKFATQFHKDHGNSSDEKVMANVYAKAARSFLAFLDAVPLAKPSNNFSIRS